MLIAWMALGVALADPAPPVAAAGPLQKALELANQFRPQRKTQGAPPIPMADYEAAFKGSPATGIVPVEGVSARKAYGVAVAPLSIGELWRGINDEAQHTGYTSVGYSELLAGKPCENGRKTFMYLPIPLLSDRWWIAVMSGNDALSAASEGKVREIYWSSETRPEDVTTASAQGWRDAAIPLGWTKGGWYLTAVDPGSTLIEYYVWTDPGGSIPAGIGSMFAAGGILKSLEAMQKYTREGKSRCP